MHDLVSVEFAAHNFMIRLQRHRRYKQDLRNNGYYVSLYVFVLHSTSDFISIAMSASLLFRAKFQSLPPVTSKISVFLDVARSVPVIYHGCYMPHRFTFLCSDQQSAGSRPN
jgi:hypothetical protein